LYGGVDLVDPGNLVFLSIISGLGWRAGDEEADAGTFEFRFGMEALEELEEFVGVFGIEAHA
jgi:hypothetical protein